MSTSVQSIIDAAILRSQQNRPEWAATYASELVQQLNRTLAITTQIGHLLAPERHLTSTPLVGVASVWTLTNNLPLYRIETAGGAKVSVVPLADRSTDVGTPRVYQTSALTYKSVGAAGDPAATDTLTFYRLTWPTTLTATGNTLDSWWPDQYAGLLVEEMAMYLALKDGRDSELERLRVTRDQWVQSYVAFLRSANLAMTGRFTPDMYVTTELANLTAAFLGGGASAQ